MEEENRMKGVVVLNCRMLAHQVSGEEFRRRLLNYIIIGT
jgi:hypothetical protein